MHWNGKPYYSLDFYLRETFGRKVYKLALDAGMTCPNRDGTLGYGGCIFCSGGSGDFAVPPQTSMTQQIELAKQKVSGKISGGSYIAYFQSFTNTYAPIELLEQIFTEAVSHPDIAGLSVGTRPDCLPPPVLELLKRINAIKPVWVELGLQTIHEETALSIRRGYPLSCFKQAADQLKDAGISVIVHVILGLPGETREMMLETVRYLGLSGIDGIKLQMLHVLEGTDLARIYKKEPFPVLSLEEYTDLIVDCIASLPPNVVIHRISGDGNKALLIAPAWSGNKRMVLNSITKCFKEKGITQGDDWKQQGKGKSGDR